MLRCILASTHLALAVCRNVRPTLPGLGALELDTSTAVVDFMNAEVSMDFSGRPDRSTWEARFETALSKGKHQGCSAPVWFCCHSSGLGSALMQAASLTMTAVYANAGFVWQQPKMWPAVLSDHLVWQVPTRECANNIIFDPAAGTNGVGLRFKQLKFIDYEYASDLWHFAMQKLWVLTDDAQREVNASLAGFGGGFASRGYFGVHVRRGDKIKEAAYVSTWKYVEAIRRASSVYPFVKNVYVASDDPGVLNEIQAALGERMTVAQAPEKERTDSSANSYFDQEILSSTVRDIEILRQAKAFIGTASSSMSKVVHFARHENKQFPDESMDTEWI